MTLPIYLPFKISLASSLPVPAHSLVPYSFILFTPPLPFSLLPYRSICQCLFSVSYVLSSCFFPLSSHTSPFSPFSPHHLFYIRLSNEKLTDAVKEAVNPRPFPLISLRRGQDAGYFRRKLRCPSLLSCCRSGLSCLFGFPVY